MAVLVVVGVLAGGVLLARLLSGSAPETSRQPDVPFDDSFARPGRQASTRGPNSAPAGSDIPPATGDRDEPADDERDFPDEELGIPVLPNAVPVSRTRSVDGSGGTWAATFTTGKGLDHARNHYEMLFRRRADSQAGSVRHGEGSRDRENTGTPAHPNVAHMERGDLEVHELPSDSGLVVTYSLVTEHDRFEVSLQDDLERGVVVIQHVRESRG